MALTTENLERAVLVFYASGHSQQAQAHGWLTEAQRCVEAWSFVWELLQPQKETEVQFFAATTLHTKLLRYWNEVPLDHYEELKNRILEAIILFSSGPKIVLDRLCISLAAYYLQRGGGCELSELLRPFSDLKRVTIMLEILTAIPEEYTSMKMTTAMRDSSYQMLRKATPGTLQEMRSLLSSAYQDTPISSEDLSMWTAVGDCSASWLSLLFRDEIPDNFSPTDLNEYLPLCDALLRVLHKIYWCGGSDLACGAGEKAACAVLRGVRATVCCGTHTIIEDINSGSGEERQPRAVFTLASLFSTVTTPIVSAVNVPNSTHQELLVEIFNTAIALGEALITPFTKALVQPRHNKNTVIEMESCVAILEMIFACLATPGFYPIDEMYSQLTLHFWYQFQTLVQMRKAVKEATPFLLRLLHTSLLKCRAPPNEMTAEDSDMFRRYKIDISDNIMHLSSVLPWETCANCAVSILVGEENANTAGLKGPALMALKAIAAGAPLNHVPDALATLLAVSSKCATFPDLVEPLLNCLGAYAPWLTTVCTDDSTVHWCKEILTCAAGAINTRPGAAALALYRLCAACAPHTAHIAPVLIQAIQSGTYNTEVVRRLVIAAGYCAVAMGAEEGSRYLAPLFSTLCKDIQIQETSHMNKTDRLEIEQKTRNALKACGILISVIFKIPSLGLPLVEAVRPAIMIAATNTELTMALFEFLNYCVSSLPDDIVHLVPEFIQAAEASLNIEPQCICIDFSRLVIVVYFDYEQIKPHVKRLLCTLVESCLQFCAGTQLVEKCDILKDLFLALSFIIKKKPDYLDLLNDQLSSAICLATSCIQLNNHAAMSACRWLSVVIKARPCYLLPHAPSIIAQFVHFIGNGATGIISKFMGEVLSAMCFAKWEQPGSPANVLVGHWLRAALQQPGYPTPRVTEQHKQNFINSITKEHVTNRIIQESVRDFSSVCRGLDSTEYEQESRHIYQYFL